MNSGISRYQAFKAGWLYGVQYGPASPREAEGSLRVAGLPTDHDHVVCYCNGTDDGAGRDRFRLLGERAS